MIPPQLVGSPQLHRMRLTAHRLVHVGSFLCFADCGAMQGPSVLRAAASAVSPAAGEVCVFQALNRQHELS